MGNDLLDSIGAKSQLKSNTGSLKIEMPLKKIKYKYTWENLIFKGIKYILLIFGAFC